MKNRGRLGVAAAVLAVAGIAGCASNQAGAAIVYSDGRVTEDVVATQAAFVADELGLVPSAQINQVIIQRLATTLVVEEAAQRRGVSVTDAEVDAALAEAVVQAGGEERLAMAALQQGIPPAEVADQVRVGLLAEKIAEDLRPGGSPEVQDEALFAYLGLVSAEMGLEVNPRFGQWVPQAFSVLPTEDTLSRPADNELALELQQITP